MLRKSVWTVCILALLVEHLSIRLRHNIASINDDLEKLKEIGREIRQLIDNGDVVNNVGYNVGNATASTTANLTQRSKDATECEELWGSRLPVNPYSPEAVANLYSPTGLAENGIHLDRTLVVSTWSQLYRELNDFHLNCDDRMAFQHLLQDGLIVSALGMDFSEVQKKRYGLDTARGDELLTDPDVSRIRKVHLMCFGRY